MKRDWDLIRQQLTDIEEEKDPTSQLPEQPNRTGQTEDEFAKLKQNYDQAADRILGHLKLLIEAGYVDGIEIGEYLDGTKYCVLYNPRLTMKGHDLLDTTRSKGVWERVKSTAKSKGIELTFDAVKQLSVVAIKNMLE
jgi:hypothetical protein